MPRFRLLRSAALGATVAAALLCADACGSSSGATAQQTGGRVTLTFWDDNAGPTSTPFYQKLITEFEAANPGITVQYTGIPSADVTQKYNTAIAGGATPDVGRFSTSVMSTIVAQGALLPLDSDYAGSSIKGQISAAFLATAKSAGGGGQLYMMPTSGNQDVIWYRTDRFQAAGLNPPNTWTDLFSDAAKLTSQGKDQYGWTIRGGSGSGFQILAEAYAYSGITQMFDANGDSTVDAPANVAFIQMVADQYKKTTPEADVDNAYPAMIAQFTGGEVDMVHHNLGTTSQVKKALGTNVAGMMLPVGPSGKHTILANPVSGFGIFQHSAHQAAAWQFIQFLDSHAADSYWNQQVGQIPANTQAYADSWYQSSGITKQAGDLLNSASTTVVQPPVYLPEYSQITKTVAEPAFQKVLLGKMSAADFAKSMADAFTAAEKKWKSKH